MDLNGLALEITKKEGKKKQINIAQAKEVVKCLCCIFHELSLVDLACLVYELKSCGRKHCEKEQCEKETCCSKTPRKKKTTKKKSTKSKKVN